MNRLTQLYHTFEARLAALSEDQKDWFIFGLAAVLLLAAIAHAIWKG